MKITKILHHNAEVTEVVHNENDELHFVNNTVVDGA